MTNNPNNLPWTIRRGPDWDSDYVYLVDCEGRELATFYNVHGGEKVQLIQFILNECNAHAPASVLEEAERSAA